MLKSYGISKLGAAGIIIGIVLLLGTLTGAFGYVFYNVPANSIALEFDQSRVQNVGGPGIYNQIGLFKQITLVKIEGVAFCAQDPEVLTKDKQRIGVKVCGTAHRPGTDNASVYMTNWSQYRTYYLDDVALVGNMSMVEGTEVYSGGLMQNIAQQAMKVCVGDRTYDESVVGSARDALRECIDTQMSGIASNYGGIEVKNVLVPNVTIGPSVQKLLDDITTAKFETELAKQNATKAAEDAARDTAIQQGQIKVEQGRAQEQQRQNAITAKLTREALDAQLQVIEATKKNELREADLNLAVAEARLKVKNAEAKATIAPETMLAQLYAGSPEYVQLLIAQTWAAAWKATDKIIVPTGTNPITVLGPNSAAPVVNVAP